jgi:hypothetical protein
MIVVRERDDVREPVAVHVGHLAERGRAEREEPAWADVGATPKTPSSVSSGGLTRSRVGSAADLALVVETGARCAW